MRPSSSCLAPAQPPVPPLAATATCLHIVWFSSLAGSMSLVDMFQLIAYYNFGYCVFVYIYNYLNGHALHG